MEVVTKIIMLSAAISFVVIRFLLVDGEYDTRIKKVNKVKGGEPFSFQDFRRVGYIKEENLEI